MARAHKPPATKPEDEEPTEAGEEGAGGEGSGAIDDGKVIDYVTGRPVADTDKERVRQRTVRALLHEFGISVDDMEPDFRVKVDGSNRKVDVAIFEPGSAHTAENVRRLVVCQKEPRLSEKSTYKIRDHEQAKREFGLLHGAMTALSGCRYGMWTNGLEIFYFVKEVTRFDVKFKPIADWPMSDESVGSREVVSNARMRRADPEMLRVSFRRCHNFIHGNEGMPKDAAFWQFLFLIFAKMYDEQAVKDGRERRFWVGWDEQFNDAGRRAIKDRIDALFKDVKKRYAAVFRDSDEIRLSERALAFMVSELAKYDFTRTEIEAKGAAYQEIVGANLRGDRGQYFTPRSAIKLVVEVLDPKPHERVFDPACGTGGFLDATVDHWFSILREKTRSQGKDTADFFEARDELRNAVNKNLFGADFDPFLVRAVTMDLTMAANALGNIFHMDSLSFPNGHLGGVQSAKTQIPLGTIDVLMTNPPFGSDIPISDPAILGNYELASKWERKDGTFVRGDGYQSAVAPEVLFLQRSVDWLREGGRLGIVLPNGVLGNPGDEYIRRWILRHCWVLASVELPVETFIADADVNILTSLLFLKKKSQTEIKAEDLDGPREYQVFMAVAEKVGVDRRGNTLYKRGPDGEEILAEEVADERVRIKGEWVTRTLHRRKKVLDNDLPEIAKRYKEFRASNPEPGL
jgi:type I restriction enzyme M protein